MEELNPLAKKILSQLVFEETYENIIGDLREESEFAVTDELKTLIVKELVKPCRDISSGKGSGFMYDSDRMKDYSFMLTGKGVSLLESLLKD